VILKNWKRLGFTRNKPKEPGVYFVRTDGHLPMAPGKRLAEHWDVAEIIYFAGSYTNASENRESSARWQIQTLSGLTYSWQRGMWIKGPIHPSQFAALESISTKEKP
jgi:hypothetical protein